MISYKQLLFALAIVLGVAFVLGITYYSGIEKGMSLGDIQCADSLKNLSTSCLNKLNALGDLCVDYAENISSISSTEFNGAG